MTSTRRPPSHATAGYRAMDRYVAWVPWQGSAPIPDGLAQSAVRAGLHVSGNRSYFLACDLDPRALGIEGPPVLASVFASERGDPVAGLGGEDVYDDVSGAHSFFALIRASEDSLEIEGDWLALRPCYYADYRDGVLIASRLADLFRIEPGLALPVDPLALSQIVSFRHPLGSRTLHQRVRRTVAGEVLSYDRATGLGIRARPRLLVGPDDRFRTPGEALEAMLAVLSASVRQLARRRGKELGIGLSAGLDSRMIAAVCRMEGLPFTAYSYGRPWQRETSLARRVGRALGADPVLLGYPGDLLLDSCDHFLRTVEGQADLSAAQITNLLRIEQKQRIVLLHGFLGDSLGGAHLDWFPKEAFRSRKELARAVVRRFTGELAAASRFFGIPVTAEDLVEEVERDLDPALPPFRAFLLWDLHQRQRRYIGTHFQLLGDTLETAAPFGDRAYAEFALSLAEPLLRGRHLTIVALRTRFPDLARIPHSARLLPALPGIGDRIRLGASATLRRMVGISGWRRIRNRLGWTRGPEFWDLASGEALVPRFLAGAEETRTALADVLGIPIDPSELRKRRVSTSLARNAFSLGAYARFLSRTLGS